MIPENHPRRDSLILRDKIVKANDSGILAPSSLIAHGRGETFDYLLGERTTLPAKRAIYVAVATMIVADNPVISVNGNTTALVIDEIIGLANELNANIEINLFYRTDERVDKIEKLYRKHGFDDILGGNDDEIKYLRSIKNPRATASKRGIYDADVVLVPLEDGDRAEILSKTDKTVICVDLNPLSRTSRKSDISIVDNIVRVIPLMVQIARDLKNQDEEFLYELIDSYDNEYNLKESLEEFKIKEGY